MPSLHNKNGIIINAAVSFSRKLNSNVFSCYFKLPITKQLIICQSLLLIKQKLPNVTSTILMPTFKGDNGFIHHHKCTHTTGYHRLLSSHRKLHNLIIQRRVRAKCRQILMRFCFDKLLSITLNHFTLAQ